MDKLKTSKESDKIFSALAAIQDGLPPISKDARNPHFNATYVTISGLLEELNPLRMAQQVAIYQIPSLSVTENGTRLDLETLFMHTSGQWVSFVTSLPLPKLDAQGVGSAITYGRRYALVAFFNIATDDDDGNKSSSVSRKPAASKTPQDLSKLVEQARNLANTVYNQNPNETELAAWASTSAKMAGTVHTFEKLDAKALNLLIKKLQARKAQ